MKIDLHIHTRTCSDGNLPIEEVFKEAKNRKIDLISITDHDSIDCQETAITLARKYGMSYITGVELNVTFYYPEGNKDVSLDFLGYGYDIGNQELKDKLRLIKGHRRKRARQILENLNVEFDKEGIERFTEEDLRKIEESVDGVFGRPHIASYLIKKGIVKDMQEAFDKYLVKCNVHKYPLSLAEASKLIRNAGGVLIQEKYMLQYIDGVECWHSRHDEKTTAQYVEFARKHDMLMTGGSDCHQKPILMGTLDIPDWVAEQFSGRNMKFYGTNR